ncbi:MAG: phosphoribosylglycinamide formyltransferase [Desulfovibrionaceae bacterium]
MPIKIAILASGSGTNAQAMFDKIAEGRLQAQVVLVISNRPGAKVLERARAAGVPTLELDHKAYAGREAFDAALVSALQGAGAELVVLAGYMRLLTPHFLATFAGRVVNIHPALLPSFPGTHGMEDAQAWGVKVAGCTVHFVDEEVDHGEVIAQAVVPVLAGEALADLQQRIHALEHRIYPQVIQWFAEGRIRVCQRQVHIEPQSSSAAVPCTGTGMAAWLVSPPLEEGF